MSPLAQEQQSWRPCAIASAVLLNAKVADLSVPTLDYISSSFLEQLMARGVTFPVVVIVPTSS